MEGRVGAAENPIIRGLAKVNEEACREAQGQDQIGKEME